MRRDSARQTAKGAEDRGATATRTVRSSLEKPPSVVSTSEKNTAPPTHPEKAETLASARRGIHSKDEGLGLREERPEQMRFIRKISARRRPCDGCKESHGHSLGKVQSGRDFTADTKGLPWWCGAWDPMLPVPGVRLRSLLREPDPTSCN